MNYFDAMQNYGTDKPDTRYEYLIKDFSKELKSKLDYKYIKCILFDKNISEHINKINEIFTKNAGEKLTILDSNNAQYLEYTKLLKIKNNNLTLLISSGKKRR